MIIFYLYQRDDKHYSKATEPEFRFYNDSNDSMIPITHKKTILTTAMSPEDIFLQIKMKAKDAANKNKLTFIHTLVM